MERRFYSCREIAVYLGLCEKSVRRLIDKNELPGIKIGGSLKVDRKRLDELLESKSKEISG